MSRMNWDRAKPRKPTEEAEPRGDDTAGPWTHRKPAPVKRYSKAEIAELMRARKA